MSVSDMPDDGESLPLPLVREGKVRKLYDAGDEALLVVTSDRVSAFDVVLPQPVPDKGRVLTQLTAWWLGTLRGADPAEPHHLLAVRDEEMEARLPALAGVPRERWAGRSMLVRRVEPFPVECVVRGHLAGSGWREYRDHRTLAGERLPAGLREGDRLPEPHFTPATKAAPGEHDETISFEAAEGAVGPAVRELRRRSLELFGRARAMAEERGLVLADTKFEFGRADDDRILLIDEVLTPDSSRFWPSERLIPGGGRPPSLDKQPIRDHLANLPDWDRTLPAPDLPPEVVEAAAERYREVFRRLTGVELDDFLPPSFRGEGVPPTDHRGGTRR